MCGGRDTADCKTNRPSFPIDELPRKEFLRGVPSIWMKELASLCFWKCRTEVYVLPEFQRYGSLSGVAEFRMWIAEIPLIIELFTLFSAGEVRKSLLSSGIPGVDSRNSTDY